MWTYLCYSDIIIWWLALGCVIVSCLSWSFPAYILSRIDSIKKKINFFLVLYSLLLLLSNKFYWNSNYQIFFSPIIFLKIEYYMTIIWNVQLYTWEKYEN